jgi:outer membrane immunogenic protein
MKQILAASVLSLMSFGALAADLPRRGAAVAPAPAFVAQPFNWSGVYIGAHAGYSLTKPRYTDLADANYNINPGMDGVTFGPYAGVNFQSGALVYGAELDLSFGSVAADADPSATFNNYTDLDQRWSGNVRVRVGYSVGSALLYVAGGVAFANIKVDDTDAGYGSSSKTHVGWTIGAGIEYAPSQNWITRGEYLYSDLRRESFTIMGSSPYSAAVAPQNHTFRVGIAYKFGGSAAPVVARY